MVARPLRTLVVAETTFTTFFTPYFIPDEEVLSSFFEKENSDIGPITQSPNVRAFFDRAKLEIDVQIGYGEDNGTERYNTRVYVSGSTGEV